MPKVSIIIPVYNVEKYLTKCLDSLVNQTFQDIEIICVNDGSTDNSNKILQDFANRDTRIKLIEKENGGLFSARHEGMKYINGEYVIFVDSDDWIAPNLVEKCLKVSENTDIIVFGAFSVREKGDKILLSKGGYDYSKIPTKFNKKNIFKFPPTAWSKMYRAEFLKENNIRFQEIKNGEDQLFFIHSMLCAKNINVVHENLYYYIKSRSGAITSVKKKTSLSPIFNCYAIEELLSNLKIDDEYKKFILGKYFEKSISWYTKSSSEISEKFYNEILKLQNHLSNKYNNFWWTKFTLNKNDKYWNTKLKIALAKL